AALALPTGHDGAAPFPYRDLILVTAVGVVLGTLVVQGLTLRPLLLGLRLRDDGSVENEVRLARVGGLRAALAAASDGSEGETADHVRHSYALQLRLAEDELRSDGRATDEAAAAGADLRVANAAVLRAATGAQRRRLLDLRADGTIGDEA